MRQAIELRGIVQGVGFRPHVVRQAHAHGIVGLCGNNDEAVFVEAEGTPEAVAAFTEALVTQAPPLAHIDVVNTRPLPPGNDTSFSIVTSARTAGARTLIPADGGCCPDCEAELFDPNDRRYRYPFISCTNCGPRLSIIKDLPYDRPSTTLAPFPLCAACQAEYKDPSNRRFHAQPIGCFDCGPTLTIDHRDGWSLTDNRGVVQRARQLLREGSILAVKGLGGYTLMADATNEETVARLRERKRRPDKPFAVMTLTPETLGEFSADALEAVHSSVRPVVLIPQRRAETPLAAESALATGVAPGLTTIGVMMPSMGLHYVLCEDMPPLIATSGNISGEPIFSDDEEARAGLSHVVDAIVSYNREISHPLEDSVISQNDRGEATVVRRGRGLAPLPLPLKTGGHCVVGVGGEMKNAFTFTRDGRAFLSPHLGDMASLRCQRLLEDLLSHWEHLHRRSPDLLVADMHPDYATTRWAQRQGLPLLQVQHHHAHALSLLTEHQWDGPAAIAVLDGTGYAPDGTIWGSEFLLFDDNPLQPRRVGHLPPFPLPGGDHAIRHPWRVAAGLLHGWGLDDGGLLPRGADMDLTLSMLEANIGITVTTSMGRYFDAAAAIMGIRHSISYDAQGPIEMQALARGEGQIIASNPVTLMGEIVQRTQDGADPHQLSADFHASLAHWVAQNLMLQAENSGIKRVGISGGVADNTLLSGLVQSELRAGDYDVLHHVLVPSGDGGLSLGQSWAGHVWLETGGDIGVLSDSGANTASLD